MKLQLMLTLSRVQEIGRPTLKNRISVIDQEGPSRVGSLPFFLSKCVPIRVDSNVKIVDKVRILIVW